MLLSSHQQTYRTAEPTVGQTYRSPRAYAVAALSVCTLFAVWVFADPATPAASLLTTTTSAVTGTAHSTVVSKHGFEGPRLAARPRTDRSARRVQSTVGATGPTEARSVAETLVAEAQLQPAPENAYEGVSETSSSWGLLLAVPVLLAGIAAAAVKFAQQSNPFQRLDDKPAPLAMLNIHTPVATEFPIKRLMCCNRGEIAIRVFRACAENGITSIGVYSEQDKLALHRYKCDEAYLVESSSPVRCYLDIDEIIKVAKTAKVDAIHPGYGFLSENTEFATKCKENGIIFVGPDADIIGRMGDKTEARNLAAECGVATIPGTDSPLVDADAAVKWVEGNGLPVMMKAAMGGGGRGMRVVREMEEVKEAFERCSSEATTAFGDGSVFLEKLVEKPRHIEVQIFADAAGDVVHLFDRDCSVQRRHQKVVEIAPASNLKPEIREGMLNDAKKLAKHIGYKNAGTVEFLVENDGSAYYFIEVNPRVQVEHTVTEEVTGIDIVQTQIRIAGGATLKELGLVQENISTKGFAIQSRVTTEDPSQGFKPDTGRLGVFRTPGGMGVRIDSAGYEGAIISPYYDSLLSKVTCKGSTFQYAAQRLYRALSEFSVEGVHTNIAFVKNVLTHPDFYTGVVDTSLIDNNPSLFEFSGKKQLDRVLVYLADLAVNGTIEEGGKPVLYSPSRPAEAVPPAVDTTTPPPAGWRDVLLKEGPSGFAKAVREHKEPLIMDTTWRDAHQSLLTTRVRTRDLAAIAPATSRALHNAYSLEMWGGATFDVSMRFLKEDPWMRLRKLRELVPNIPFQMLLRGANAVGYTSYSDNAVREFCKQAHKEGVDVFRVFDSLNYIENLKFGIDAVRESDGVVEATVCYTGNVLDVNSKYNLEYYLNLTRQLVEHGIDILAIKDMAGLLRPEAGTLLIGALRAEFPDLPIHVHTHDSAGTGAATLLACVNAGADVVDGAVDALSNGTSQPALGTLSAILSPAMLPEKELYGKVNDYWSETRSLYSPFEAGIVSASSDVYNHEMPGGQTTNLKFQSEAVGLAGRWDEVKKAYAMANRVLGDIVKVTPSSKVVGDLALFMVQNDLNEETVVEKAEKLNFPDSVLDFLNGRIGVPAGGFPEPFRTRVLRGQPPTVPDGSRPGLSMEPMDFNAEKKKMSERERMPFTDDKGVDRKPDHLYETDLLSNALYPEVHKAFLAHLHKYGATSCLPTTHFFAPMQIGEEVNFNVSTGESANVKLVAIGNPDDDGMRRVFFEVNGQQNSFDVLDRASQVNTEKRAKADASVPGHLGCSMKGLIVDVLKGLGDEVEEGDPICILSAMKMETVMSAPMSGIISELPVAPGDGLDQGDLVAVVTAGKPRQEKTRKGKGFFGF